MIEKKKTTVTVVQAAPGFDAVELSYPPADFTYTPIVAWAVHVYVGGDGYATGSHADPVTADQILDFSRVAVRQPDGSIIFPCFARFAKGKEAEALAYAVEVDEARAAGRKMAAKVQK